MPQTTLMGLCFNCEHAFNTYIRRPRCSKCGSRRVLKATPDDVISYIKEKYAASLKTSSRPARREPRERPEPKRKARAPDVPDDVEASELIGIPQARFEKIRADFNRLGRSEIPDKQNLFWLKARYHMTPKQTEKTLHWLGTLAHQG